MSDEKRIKEIEEKIKISFPCDYPLRVVGNAVENFDEIILGVIRKYVPDLDENTINKKESRNGKYQSISMVIVATGKPQLQKIFDDLKATGIVQMVL